MGRNLMDAIKEAGSAAAQFTTTVVKIADKYDVDRDYLFHRVAFGLKTMADISTLKKYEYQKEGAENE